MHLRRCYKFLACAGLTAVDVAINCRNVALVRKLELRSPFQAMLLMKVPKWANLGTEWKHRCRLGLNLRPPNLPNPSLLNLGPSFTVEGQSSVAAGC